MAGDLTTWRKCLNSERIAVGDTSPIVHIAPDETRLDEEFDANYGRENGSEVLVWSEDRVYFPACYDGLEWIASAPRNPTDVGQEHVGG